jgi:hypothetical protein
MLVTLPKNLNEKMVANTPKKVDEKRVTTLPKNVDEKCWQHFRKILTKNIGKNKDKTRVEIGKTELFKLDIFRPTRSL